MEILWTNGRKLVDVATGKKFFAAFSVGSRRPTPAFGRFRAVLRLFRRGNFLQSSLLVVTIHRFEEHIAGRTYLIEVSPVDATRWRAQIARRPGMPTSLMPFYGRSPDEAAQQLSKWLSLVSTAAVANT